MYFSRDTFSFYMNADVDFRTDNPELFQTAKIFEKILILFIKQSVLTAEEYNKMEVSNATSFNPYIQSMFLSFFLYLFLK